MEILQRVISVSQNNQEAIELYVEAMRKLGELESAYNQLSASPFRALLLQVRLEDMDAESVIRETEGIVNNGGGLHVPWASIYDRFSTCFFSTFFPWPFGIHQL